MPGRVREQGVCRRNSLGSPAERGFGCAWLLAPKKERGLFTVQSDPGYSGANCPFHGFTGLGPLFPFKVFLTFGDVAAQGIPNSRKNEKRIKEVLPSVGKSC